MDYDKYKAEELKTYTDHFSEKYSKDINNYAESLFPDYIFTRKEKGQQYGYCTSCKKEFKTKKLRHKENIKCPKCKEDVTVQSSGMGRSKMINEVYFLYYEKSKIDPKAIVARGIYAVEDYGISDYKKVRPLLTDKSLYVFKLGESAMLKKYVWYDETECKMRSYGNFEKTSTIHSELKVWALKNRERGYATYSRNSIAKAVEGTPYQYSTWEEYNDEPMVKFFELYSKYPHAVENLTKLGFYRIIDAKLTGNNTCGSVNWRGKTVFNILRLNRMELKQIRGSNLTIEPLYLKLYQINKKDKYGFNINELKEAEREFGSNQIKEINFFLKYTTLKKAFNYMKKQCSTCKSSDGKRHFHSIQGTLISYRDYIEDCITLGMDIREQVLFPKNLYAAHQNTITQVKVKENEKFNVKIAKRVPMLNEKYCFEYLGILIRPARDSKELIEEGKALSHCVGTYAERYADGRTNILFIRKLSAPDKPYYTIEIDNINRIVQTHGNKNCAPNKEVEEFIKAFKNEKLTEKKKQIKTRISIPA